MFRPGVMGGLGRVSHFSWDFTDPFPKFSVGGRKNNLDILFPDATLGNLSEEETFSVSFSSIVLNNSPKGILVEFCVKFSFDSNEKLPCAIFPQGSDRRSMLLQYFHDTATAKARAVKQYMLDQLESGHKFLLFAHHQELLNPLEEALKEVSLLLSRRLKQTIRPRCFSSA